MPLFGKHNKKSDHHDAKHDARHADRDADTNMNTMNNQNPGQQGFAPGPQAGGPNHHQQPGFNNTTTGNPNMTGGDPYSGEPGLPPVNHIDANNNRSGGAGGRLAGKAERAAGALVGSQALKEKGYQKQQEAGAFKMQSAEIAEAERLEKEALMRRERAVAHGAHPGNRHLGGLQNANTLSDVTGGQAGQPSMGPAGGPGY